MAEIDKFSKVFFDNIVFTLSVTIQQCRHRWLINIHPIFSLIHQDGGKFAFKAFLYHWDSTFLSFIQRTSAGGLFEGT